MVRTSFSSHILRNNQHLLFLPIYSEREALEILANLHGGGDTSNESVVLAFEAITHQVTHSALCSRGVVQQAVILQVYSQREEGTKSFTDLLIEPGIFRRIMLGASLQMWAQLSGMTIMMCAWPTIRLLDAHSYS